MKMLALSVVIAVITLLSITWAKVLTERLVVETLRVTTVVHKDDFGVPFSTALAHLVGDDVGDDAH
jgi:hypothetical protein